MFSYVWPIALVVLSNVVYQICAKSVPEEMNPFASLTVTYLVGAVVSAILYFYFWIRRESFQGIHENELGSLHTGPGYCGTGSRLDLCI